LSRRASQQGIAGPAVPKARRFDYSSAAIYFVTICTKDKRSLFGQITGSQM
jgi:hypothetical protein